MAFINISRDVDPQWVQELLDAAASILKPDISAAWKVFQGD